MNTKLLLKVKAAILAEPRKFDIRHWFVKSDKSPCGTAACIAGHAVAIGRRYESLKSGLALVKNDWLHSTAQDIADDIMELTNDQSMRLFVLRGWPNSFHDDYIKAERNMRKRARIAAARIDHFIKTEDRE